MRISLASIVRTDRRRFFPFRKRKYYKRSACYVRGSLSKEGKRSSSYMLCIDGKRKGRKALEMLPNAEEQQLGERGGRGLLVLKRAFLFLLLD